MLRSPIELTLDYMCFTLDHSERDALNKFVARFGHAPTEIIHDDLLRLGPVTDDDDCRGDSRVAPTPEIECDGEMSQPPLFKDPPAAPTGPEGETPTVLFTELHADVALLPAPKISEG